MNAALDPSLIKGSRKKYLNRQKVQVSILTFRFNSVNSDRSPLSIFHLKPCSSLGRDNPSLEITEPQSRDNCALKW